jgi:hypothetical protein
MVERRTETSRSFRRSDGLTEVRVSPEPVAYDTGDGDFELIDTSVEPTDSGARSIKNSFQVFFGSTNQGVTIVLPSGERMTSEPALMDGAAPTGIVAPEVDESDDSVVWYRQVWPGVDLRYRVRPGGLAEDIVYTQAPTGAGAVTFSVSGAELDAAWSLPAPTVIARSSDSVPPRPVEPSETLSGIDSVGTGEPSSVEQLDFARALADLERPPGGLPTLRARGELGSEVRFGQLAVTTGADASFVADEVAQPLVRSTVPAPEESLVELSLDSDWMRTLPPRSVPRRARPRRADRRRRLGVVPGPHQHPVWIRRPCMRDAVRLPHDQRVPVLDLAVGEPHEHAGRCRCVRPDRINREQQPCPRRIGRLVAVGRHHRSDHRPVAQASRVQLGRSEGRRTAR